MPYLTRNDLESIAKRVVTKFYALSQTTVDMRKIEPVQIATRILGLSIEHLKLSMNGSILGITSYGNASISIFDISNSDSSYYLDGKTILIEKSLCAEDQRGRYNFTVAHEVSHQILKLLYPDEYGIRKRTAILYRTDKHKHSSLEWEEWQANTLAASILMPPDLVRKCLYRFGFNEKIHMLNRIFAHDEYVRFCCMAEFLGVSKEALAIRLGQLGVLDHNYLHNPYAIMDIEN